MSACASTTWKEEVALHDGTKIVVTRSQTRGGRHEIGQEVPVAEHTMAFTNPKSHQRITWKSTYGIQITDDNLQPILLDILGDIPYLASRPAGCIAYNKWDRPNPPYVFMKFHRNSWQQIPMTEFPKDLKKANLVVNIQADESKLVSEYSESGIVPSKKIDELNKTLPDEYRTIIRAEIKTADTSCRKMIYSNGVWDIPGSPLSHPIKK